MNNRLLRTFISVATHRNFSAAARELNTVQPAVSRQISDLESELGVRLLWRNTREVQVTAAGQCLYQEAINHLVKEHEIRERVIRTARGEFGQLRIGYLASACFSFIPQLVKAYKEAFPDVHVTLDEMTVQEQIHAFESEQIDIGFSRPRPPANRKGFTSELIYNDHLAVVLPEHHRFVDQKTLALKQIKKEPFVLFKREQAIGLFNQIITACQKEKFTPLITNQPTSMQTVLTTVASGLGVAVVPNCIRRLHSQGCVFIPIRNMKPTIPTELHYRSQSILPTVEAFVNITLEMKPEIQKWVQ